MTDIRQTDKERNDDRVKLTMAGLTIIMAGTLFIYFLWAVINERFLISFSIDAVVGVGALVFLTKNLLIKYNTIKKYGSNLIYIAIDIVFFAICIAVKMLVKLPFDFSLIILVIPYFITKKLFNRLTTLNI